MKILFLSIGDFPSIRHHEIYPDLLRELMKKGHDVFVVCSREKRLGLPTELIEEDGAKLLKVHIGNITKTNIVEKGISTVLVGYHYKKAIKKYFNSIKFDLILYSTPPITLSGVVEYIKNRDMAKTYLLLKDIFPQNAVDIGILTTKGVKGLIYRYFRRQEKKLYSISDKIGCMSKANVEYVKKKNPEIDSSKIEICPNSFEIIDKSVDPNMRDLIRKKYNIPTNKKVFVYGGNLGKPQGISYLIECLRKCSEIDAYFLIIGNGTEFKLLDSFIQSECQSNVKLMNRLPKDDYDVLVGACDVGLIFLDHRFTIPNFPSRILSYMQAKLPVLASTDPNTDIGIVIEEGKFGWWDYSDSSENFKSLVCHILDILDSTEINQYKINSFDYLKNNYSVTSAANIILKEIII